MTDETMSAVPPDARQDGQEWLSEVMHRPGGRWLAMRFLATPVTPNQLTVLGGLIGAVAGVMMVAGATRPLLLAGGGVVLWIACLFDCADGELARARRQQSPLGMMLDGLTDNVVGTSVFVGMAYDVVVYTGQPWLWLLGIAAGLSAAAHVWVYDARKRQYLQCLGLAEVQAVSDVAAQRHQARREGRTSDAFLLTAYEFFRRSQSLGVGDAMARDPVRFRRVNRWRMRAWTCMGSSTHFVPLYVAAIISPLWPPAMLACVLFYIVGLNALFVFLLLGRWQAA